MVLLSSLVMEEVSPPLTQLGSQGPSAFWAACCEVETGESQVETGEVEGNAS